jgi:3-(3-hydroxy-phenyl)propionate hydroxylase
MTKYDVAIVGYGPTGLMLASLLGQRGHRVLVLERWPQLYGKARLGHIDGETARLLSLACDINAALKNSGPIGIAKLYNGKGTEILDLQGLPSPPMGYPDHISIYQPDIEDSLDARVRSYDNVTVLQGYEVTGIVPDAGGVTLTYTTPDHSTETAHAAYLVGADGANSTVRKALGLKRIDHGFRERWLNIDGIFHGNLTGRLKHVTMVCDTERGHMSMPLGTVRRRFEFAILDNESAEEMATKEAAGKLLRRHFDLDISEMDVERLIVYEFECRSAETWRQGRVLLGGDAAHTMPPTLGQGACSAIRDAANLAWKLDLVLRGLAPDRLLDTYETERRPHVSAIQKAAMGFGSIVNTKNKFKAAIRDAVFRLKILPPPPPFPPIGDGVKQNTQGKKYAAKIGLVPPHGKVEVDGRQELFDQFAGYNFSIVAMKAALDQLSSSHYYFLEKIGARIFVISENNFQSRFRNLKDVDGHFNEFLRRFSVQALLLRPDTNLFGLAEGAAELSTLVEELRSKIGA